MMEQASDGFVGDSSDARRLFSEAANNSRDYTTHHRVRFLFEPDMHGIGSVGLTGADT